MVSRVGKVIQEEFLEMVLGPKCAKSGLFSKARVSAWVRVRVSFSRCEVIFVSVWTMLPSQATVEKINVNFVPVWMMLPAEATVQQMVVIFVSVWTMLPSEVTVESMVVIFVSVWTMLPSEETIE